MKPIRKLAIAAALALSQPALAAFTIDGNLVDWGLQANGNSGDWTPNAGVRYWTQEDQKGSGSYFLDPGWGGQRYDAEAIYLTWDATNVYVAVVTGLPPNNPQNPSANSYAPGDFAFDFGGDGSFDFGLVTTAVGGLTVGGLYGNVTWNYGLWSAPQVLGPSTTPTAVKSGTLAGSGSLAYPQTGKTGMGIRPADTHYFIEASIPVSAFGAYWNANGPTQDIYMQWTMYCGNDVIGVGGEATVPEPATALLLALGLGALGFARRRG